MENSSSSGASSNETKIASESVKFNRKINTIDSYPKKFNTREEQFQQIIAGGTSGAITRFASQPLDVLKIRFQLQVEPIRPNQESKYKSISHALKLIYKEEGLFALWKGHNPGQILSILYGISQFWTYEQSKLFMCRLQYLNESPNLSNFLSGSLAGAAATMISMPLDVIRTRLVAQDAKNKGYTSAVQAFKKISKSETIFGLYRGLSPALLQMMPLMGLNFMFYRLFGGLVAESLNLNSRMDLPVWGLFLLGGLSGTLSKSIVYPFDLIKKRLQIQGFTKYRSTYGKNIQCQGIISCTKLTIKEEGLLGLYKGIAPTLFKSAYTSALHFCFYDTILDFIKNR